MSGADKDVMPFKDAVKELNRFKKFLDAIFSERKMSDTNQNHNHHFEHGFSVATSIGNRTIVEFRRHLNP